MKREKRIHERNKLGELSVCCIWELAINWKAKCKNDKEAGKITTGISTGDPHSSHTDPQFALLLKDL